MCPWHRKMFPTFEDEINYLIQEMIDELWERDREEEEWLAKEKKSDSSVNSKGEK